MKKGCLIGLWVLIAALGSGTRALAKEASVLEELDLGEAQQILDREAEGSFSLKETAGLLLGGDWKGALSGGVKSLGTALFSQFSESGEELLGLLLLGAAAALFTVLAQAFSGHQVSETAFYLSYLLMAGVLFGALSQALSIAEQTLGYLFSFVGALLPAFFVAVAGAGGSLTALGFYQLTFFVLTAVQWAFLTLFLPGLKLYGALLVLNSLTREDLLSGVAELLQTAFSWGLKTVMGLALGLQVIQGMTLPFADSIAAGGLRKLLGALPGIGGSAQAVAGVVLGSGTLVKNGLGMAGVMGIGALCLLPLCKVAFLSLLYQGAGALLQPISDKRLLAGIRAVASAVSMGARLLLCGMLVFLLTIALICAFTNTTYFAG